MDDDAIQGRFKESLRRSRLTLATPAEQAVSLARNVAPQAKRRLRILLSAYACEPGKGSEPGNGWNWARELSHREEVWVLTRANNQHAIEKAIAAEALPNVHFLYLDFPRWALFWKRGSRGMRLYYYAWQAMAYRKARRLHRRVRFDLIHHVSFSTYVYPSFLSLLPIPFVWGPVAGGESVPESLARSFGARRRMDEFLRSARRWLGERDPFVRQTAQRAVLVAATTEQTQRKLAGLGRPDASVIPHAALGEQDFSLLREIPPRIDGPFRVLSVGRMVQFKAFDFGLRAFAILKERCPDCEYWLIGDGPERQYLANLAHKLKIEDGVTFLGARPRGEVFATLAECDLMLFPSLHDSSGWVCIEAMAAGRPVVCLDLGGPALQVAPDRGIKVRAETTAQLIADLGKALVRLAGDRALRFQMGRAARSYAETHCRWSQTVQNFDDAYRHLPARAPYAAGNRRSPRDFGNHHRSESPIIGPADKGSACSHTRRS